MSRIPFNIKYRPEIEAGKYKVKVGENEARIVCWDFNGDNLIVCVKIDGGEQGLIYDTAGRHMTKLPEPESDLELYTDEPDELTEFEKAVKEAILTWHNPKEWSPEDSFIREIAEKPLASAREQIHREHSENGIRYITDKEFADYMRRERIDGYERGQEDAEKRHKEATSYHYGPFPSWQPPCFHGGSCTNPHHDCINCPHTGTSGIAKTDTNIK